MSTTDIFAPTSASALAPGDTILSPLGYTGQVVSVDQHEVEHWHVIVANHPLQAVLFGSPTSEVVAGPEDVFMVRIIIPDYAPEY